MVPACQKCDDSKQHKPFDEWIVGGAPSSPASRGIPDLAARINRIHAYVARYNYVVRPLEDRLTETERRELTILRESIASARLHAETLIESFYARVTSTTVPWKRITRN
jgi:hypothetical protein